MANRPVARKTMRQWLLMADGLYILGLLLLTAFNVFGPEQTWFGSLNLYLPQWIWGIPGVLLLLLTLLLSWRLLWLPLLCLLWVAGPIMGYCWHWPRSAHAGKGIHLRVMTYNIKGGRRNADAIVGDLQRFHPDVIQMQDSQGVMNGPVGKALSGWYISASGQYIIVSRFPISDADGRNISFPGSAHHCVRSTLMVEGKPLTIYNVHLLSPRYGLVAIKYHHVRGIEQNTEDRMFEAKMLVDALRAEKGPLILTGDLNAPVQSQVCQQLFATGLRDAFSDAGWGYGYSYGQTTRVRVPYVRIDHILVNEAWHVERCMVGNRAGSDHSPVIADLFLQTAE